MAKYLIRVRDNPSALQGAIKEGFAAREKYMRGLIEAQGGKVEAWYHAYGEDDLIVIVDIEPAAGMAISLALNQSGAVRQTTTPLLTSAEMDEARAKLPQYRAPGA
jgi:uncharacterized protein with GYD domain